MKAIIFISVALFLVLAVSGEAKVPKGSPKIERAPRQSNSTSGFGYEYRKFDNYVKNWISPPAAQHMDNLKKAIPFRLLVDVTAPPSSYPRVCYDDNGASVACETSIVKDTVVSSYVDVVVKLPWQSYPVISETIQNDPNNATQNRRRELLDNYTASTDANIKLAVSQSGCTVLTSTVTAVGYTTKYGYMIGVFCPDDKTYRTKLATNVKFYQNVVQAKLGRTLNAKVNLASANLMRSSLEESLGTPGKKSVNTVKNKIRLTEETESETAQEKKYFSDAYFEKRQQTPVNYTYYSSTYYSAATGYLYNNTGCGGVWYNDFLDGKIDGLCISNKCSYIKDDGINGQFYLIDTGVDTTHPEFANAMVGTPTTRRLKTEIVLRTELQVIYTDPVSGLPYGKYQFYEHPEQDLQSHGTAITSITIGDVQGIVRKGKLTSFKVITENQGMVEYAVGNALQKIYDVSKTSRWTSARVPTVIITGINFIYPYESCLAGPVNCALFLVQKIQDVILLGNIMVMPAGNGFWNTRDFAFPPPGLPKNGSFPTGYDICHWAKYVHINPNADAQYITSESEAGITAYYPMYELTGEEVFPYYEIRPFRITGFDSKIKMVPWTRRNTHFPSGLTVFDASGFNYGDCIDFAAPGADIERLAVLNNVNIGEFDPTTNNWFGFTSTNSNYKENIYDGTEWGVFKPNQGYKSTGMKFSHRYMTAPYLTGGTSFATPMAGAVFMSVLLNRYNDVYYAPKLEDISMYAYYYMNMENVMGTYSQYHLSYDITYTNFARLNQIWEVEDPELVNDPGYLKKKTPTFRPIKMMKVDPRCVNTKQK